MTKPTQVDLEYQIEQEWRRLHHNATLLHVYQKFNFRNDYEANMFDDHILEIEQQDLKSYLEESAVELYTFTLTFWQYGRSGATFAPSEWMCNSHSGHLGAFNSDIIHRWDFDNNIDHYNYTARVLKCLEWINTAVRAWCSGLPESWESYKEANGITPEQLAEYDGKTLTYRQVACWN